MTLPYFARLWCLVLASFFLIHLAVSLLTALYTPRALRNARKLPSGTAARFLLTLRLLPVGLAIAGALGLCVPSYLWFEPQGIEEQVGFACLLMALLGCATCGIAVLRATRAAIRSLLFARRCRRSGHEMDFPANRQHALVIESSQPFLALTGIIHPRVVISQGIVNALSAEELSVVLSHESAHRASFDNLKRLCISLAPGFGALERAWIRYAEYAADERAVAGDVRQSVALASALVRVARFGKVPAVSPIAISFLGDVCDLSDRVDRLLTLSPRIAPVGRTPGKSLITALTLSACLALIAFNSTTFRFVQSLLERLIR